MLLCNSHVISEAAVNGSTAPATTSQHIPQDSGFYFACFMFDSGFFPVSIPLFLDDFKLVDPQFDCNKVSLMPTEALNGWRAVSLYVLLSIIQPCDFLRGEAHQIHGGSRLAHVYIYIYTLGLQPPFKHRALVEQPWFVLGSSPLPEV